MDSKVPPPLTIGPALFGVTPSRWVRISPLKLLPEADWEISIASLVTGLTVRAMEQKIDSGVWKREEVWDIGPDGKRYLYIPGYEKWVAKGRPQE